MAAAMFSHIDIGLRHILPIYIGICHRRRLRGDRGCLKTATRRTWPAGRSGDSSVFGWPLRRCSHPDYIPYFNELAGGHPENILVDSDLDWGQDMNRLGARLREVGAPRWPSCEPTCWWRTWKVSTVSPRCTPPPSRPPCRVGTRPPGPL